MPNTNYAARVSDLYCSIGALNIVIKELEDSESTGAVYILEKIRETINTGAVAFDELIYARGKQRGES